MPSSTSSAIFHRCWGCHETSCRDREVFELGRDDPFTMHHWAATFYFALDAWVHWFNAFGQFEHEPRGIYNAIPFAVFLILGLLRRTLNKADARA